MIRLSFKNEKIITYFRLVIHIKKNYIRVFKVQTIRKSDLYPQIFTIMLFLL